MRTICAGGHVDAPYETIVTTRTQRGLQVRDGVLVELYDTFLDQTFDQVRLCCATDEDEAECRMTVTVEA
jgi:hypothetical protein